MIKRSSEVIINHTRLTKWGIIIVAFWALVLAVLSMGNLLVLTTIVRLNTNEGPTQTQIWIVFVLNLLFLLGFIGSSYGLFKRSSWGRTLFLWIISMWAGANLMALFVPILSTTQGYSQAGILNAIRYAVALILPLWYLNLPQVKMAFQAPINNSTEDITTDENIN